MFSGAEKMMSDFAKALPRAFKLRDAEPLYLRLVAILVRPGNPKKIRRFRDLLKPGVKVLTVAGAGQTGSGTVASIVMMPIGFLFKALDLRVGHYGPKLGEFLFGLRPEPGMQVLFHVQHVVIGWLSAVPLLLFWRCRSPRSPSLADSLLYGALLPCHQFPRVCLRFWRRFSLATWLEKWLGLFEQLSPNDKWNSAGCRRCRAVQGGGRRLRLTA
ncbi:MAG: hypothetical protein LH479_09635 [Polaromonas sp.]|nr:hypothetical protein [Polaromonas sp.]